MLFMLYPDLEKRDQSLILAKGRYRGSDLMVWVGISLSRCTNLHAFSCGTLNVYMYREDILAPYTIKYASTAADSFILMDYNVWPYCAAGVLWCFEDQGFEHMGLISSLAKLQSYWTLLGLHHARGFHPLTFFKIMKWTATRVKAYMGFSFHWNVWQSYWWHRETLPSLHLCWLRTYITLRATHTPLN